MSANENAPRWVLEIEKLEAELGKRNKEIAYLRSAVEFFEGQLAESDYHIKRLLKKNK